MTVEFLKKNFYFVSWCQSSVPTPGSMTKKAELLECEAPAEIKNVILHKDKRLTLVTDLGYLQFFN